MEPSSPNQSQSDEADLNFKDSNFLLEVLMRVQKLDHLIESSAEAKDALS